LWFDPDPLRPTRNRFGREARKSAIDKHVRYIEEAGKAGVQILCLQEIFTGPYFCAEQTPKWYDATEPIPDGPTTKLMQELARKYKMVIVAPLYEVENVGVYYNTAAVIDADGSYLGKYRKMHIPQVAPGFWEKYYFRPGNLGYPVFKTAYATIGVYICYDRHFPEGARALGLNGAEIVFNPSATVAGLSEYLWKLEQPAHAVANGYFIGAINRVGVEAPWNIGEFYGSLFLQSARPDHRRGQPGQGRAGGVRPRSRHDQGGAQHLAVLPGSPSRELQGSGGSMSTTRESGAAAGGAAPTAPGPHSARIAADHQTHLFPSVATTKGARGVAVNDSNSDRRGRRRYGFLRRHPDRR
jgi:N-carbamoylputrescine amidase